MFGSHTCMRKVAHKFWFWGLVQVFIVAEAMGRRFYVGTSAYLARPTDGDTYAHNWSFQGMSFLIVGVPIILVGLAVLLCVERFILRMILKRQAMLE